MPNPLELLDSAAIKQLPEQTEPWSEWARRYVSAVKPQGVQAYIENADVIIELMRSDTRLVPVVLCDRKTSRWRAAVCSPTSHFVHYSGEEAVRRTSWLRPFWSHAARIPLRLMLHWGGCEKAAYFNEWLWASSPLMPLKEVATLGSLMAFELPDYAIVIRGLLDGYDTEGVERLCEAGFSLIPSRTVFLADTGARDYKRPENIRKDLRLHLMSGYEVVSDPDILLAYTARLVELYTQLYIGKYSRLNQSYSEAYFRMVLETGMVKIMALRKNHSIDAFFAVTERSGMMVSPFIGYDLSKPRELGLYRQVFALLFKMAEQSKLVLHLSAGVGAFKELRGGQPVTEFWAVYTRHLPWTRRMPWRALQKAVHLKWARHPYVTKTNTVARAA